MQTLSTPEHVQLIRQGCPLTLGIKPLQWVLMLEDVVVTRQTDGQMCPLGVCSYVLETLDMAHLARN